MSGLERLIREIHRRSLWQVLGTYGAASWVVLEVVDLLWELLSIPSEFTAKYVRLDPAMDAIRETERFQAAVAASP